MLQQRHQISLPRPNALPDNLRPIVTSTTIEGAWQYDPLEEDDETDTIFVTSQRRLIRLAIAAADAGARFGGDRSQTDPAAWMLAPRRLFNGRPPIEACQSLDGFTKSIILHGLDLGVDACPSMIDDLNQTPNSSDGNESATTLETTVDSVQPRRDASYSHTDIHSLVSGWINHKDEGIQLIAFRAMVVAEPADFLKDIVHRYGSEAARTATITIGFDRTSPLATAFLSDALTYQLDLVASDPTSSLGAGLDILIEQRFDA